jgi:hypothetical protein
MHTDHPLSIVARAYFTFDKQLQHRGDRTMFGLGDLLKPRMRLGLEANSHPRTGGGRSV